MPVYEYECGACGERFEAIQKYSDPPIAECRSCGAARVRKVLSPTAFVLKGGGWYVTDYPSDARKKGAESEKGTPEKSAPAAAPSCSTGACSGSCGAKS